MNILLIKLKNLGETLFTLPSLELIRKNFPNAHITYLVGKSIEHLVAFFPHIDEHLVVGRDVISNWRGIKRLRRSSWDMALDFQGNERSRFWLYFSDAYRTVGWRTDQWTDTFLTDLVDYQCSNLCLINRYLFLAHRIVPRRLPVSLSLPMPEAEKPAALEWLRAHQLEAGSMVVYIAPTYQHAHRWPTNYVKILITKVNQLGFTPVIWTTHSFHQEAEALQHILPAKSNYVLLSENHLPKVLWLFKLARAVVGGDSDWIRLADAIGANLLAIFGPTAPYNDQPLNPHSSFLYLKKECSPCYDYANRCRRRICLEEIPPETIMDELRRISKATPEVEPREWI